MKQIRGTPIYDSLVEMVAPDHTALVVIDMQNDLCAPEGVTAKAGADLTMINGMMPHLVRLLEEARRVGVLVVFLKLTDNPQGTLVSPAWLHFGESRKFLKGVIELVMEGTWGWEITGELSPHPGEPVILKHRSDGFADTRLNSILRSNKIETVVTTGVATHGCVEATARGASCHDYYVVVPKDCMASRERSLHEASLKVMSALYEGVSSDRIIAAWHNIAACVRPFDPIPQGIKQHLNPPNTLG